MRPLFLDYELDSCSFASFVLGGITLGDLFVLLARFIVLHLFLLYCLLWLCRLRVFMFGVFCCFFNYNFSFSFFFNFGLIWGPVFCGAVFFLACCSFFGTVGEYFIALHYSIVLVFDYLVSVV